MAHKSSSDSESKVQPKLLVSRTEATVQLEHRLTKADELLARVQLVRNEEELDILRKERLTWSDYNHELLERIFSTPQYATQYSYSDVQIFSMKPSFHQWRQHEIDILSDKKQRLQSIIERLTLIEEVQPVTLQSKTRPIGKNVFIVHGHDEKLKLEVARYIERLQLTAIILAEKANQGRTIIEKFEKHAEAVDFAIILLTPDDFGGAKGTDSKPRARQNVILELGYFIGKLGRNAVCALHKSGVELPSDILGIVYVSADVDWRLQLANEMKAAGLDIDLNRAV